MFAMMVRGDDEGEISYRKYVLAELRAARTRALLVVNEIETIGVALRGGIVDADLAVEWLRDAGAMGYLMANTDDDAVLDPSNVASVMLSMGT
jgi:hypothetical protein